MAMRRKLWRGRIGQTLSKGRLRWARACLPVFALAFASCVGSLAQAEEPDGTHLPGETFRDCPDCVELVVIPSGEFQMGSNEKPTEQPIHRVAIRKDFAIGRREVTFKEWDQCVAAGGCKFSPSDQGWGRGDRPVTNVSWDDAQEFIGWLTKTTGKPYRLPTESEWEYSARGGSTTPYWWGKDISSGRAQCADCKAGESGKPAPVGSFRPNAFGLYDTSGNAAEWVQDCWNPTYRGAPNDGSAAAAGDCSLRVLRGGSFADKAASLRSSARFRYDGDVRYYANGFRVARDLN
jgi:formylglycine-generating enzyme required for sulfatase activity